MSSTLLYNKLLNEMEKKIIDGAFIEGEKLPSERKISEEYSISRNIVRQVLSTLEEKGLVNIIPSKGTFVTAYNEDKLKESLKLIANKHNSTIEDILETREMFEFIIIEKAIKKRTDEDINILTNLCLKMDKNITLNEFLELDLQYHKALAKSTHNEILYILIHSFYDLTENFAFTVTKYNNNYMEVIKNAQSDHWRLIDSLKNQNSEKATTIIKEHMASFREEVKVIKNVNYS